jgi:glutamate synthase domain-containing protein 1/glutamate synthase domain-containing protein 3
MMPAREQIEKLLASRKGLTPVDKNRTAPAKSAMEGGCGVIGIASSEQIAGRHLLQALDQMRNRGNGKGGGIAAVGLVPEEMGVSRDVLENDYLLSIAYLDPSSRTSVERDYIHPQFEVDHVRTIPTLDDYRELEGLDVQPPDVTQYFVRVRPEVADDFARSHGLEALQRRRLEDEVVYQNSFQLNRQYYATTGESQAFVVSHGKNLMVLKMVGYGDDVVRYYQLEGLHAYVWIGHHRYPTKGRVWHPGGAHPFVGLNEALVHNGDFANYASICEYLAQRDIHPLFLTDTEVSVLVYDLLHRTYGYPLEYVIEALAPTTERDFTLLPPEKQLTYEAIQVTHMHSSPDGPWFFLIAENDLPENGWKGPRLDPDEPEKEEAAVHRLIGITDTSMLRPQVFALQEAGPSGPTIGFAASEKQAIDAALESLTQTDSRFWRRADRYWNARGGSHTDGGAFIFGVYPKRDGSARLVCTDKFGRRVTVASEKLPYVPTREFSTNGGEPRPSLLEPRSSSPTDLFNRLTGQLPDWDYDEVSDFLRELVEMSTSDDGRSLALDTLKLLMDRRYPTGDLRRSSLLALYDRTLSLVVEGIQVSPSERFLFTNTPGTLPRADDRGQIVVIDARGFSPEGDGSLAGEIIRLYEEGFRRFLIAHARGHRFIGNGLGPDTEDIHIDVFGSSGDYLASGIDGVSISVHGDAQDQIAQIMKSGKLVVYGDVGQTFMYAAKGGEAYVLGNAAGRPLINAVGGPRVVINGTCLDYLAESFMAGDPFDGGGFVILNGITFDENGAITEMDTPYPGGNLFSLASGGAIYLRDPHEALTADQLNGGEFLPLTDADWDLIQPYLEENARLFGIPVDRLLEVEGQLRPPGRVYRKVSPRTVRALQAEEAWVRKE